MPRQIPTPSVSNLRSAAQAVRAAISGMTGAVADAFTALAGGLDQAQTAIETLEGKNRELGSPDARDPRANSTAYVSGDRIINGIQVQGGLATNAGQGLDLTFEDQVATIASKDHKDNALLALVIQGYTVAITGTTTIGGAQVATVGDTAWTNINAVGGAAPAYENAWANAFSTARYKKDGMGNVQVQGSANSGTLPSAATPITVFKLAAGYRPTQGVYLKLVNASNVTVPWTVTEADVQILTSGEVQLVNCGSNTFLSLNFTFSIL